MNTTVKITNALEMVGFLKTNKTNCQFVSMLTVTEPKLLKRHPLFRQYNGVKKVSRRSGILNMNYNKAVRNRIASKLGVEVSEVEYENGNVWYKHLTTEEGKNLPLVVNKTKDDGKHYVQYFPRKSTTTYVMPNGEIVPESTMKEITSKETKSEYKPAVCAFNIENIKELKARKIVMKTQDAATAEKILVGA